MKTKALLAIIIFTRCTFSQGLNDVFSPVTTTVYAVGSSGLTLKSGNAGNTYSQTFVGTSNLYCVFGIGNYVWSAGENGTLNKSVNSGTSWDTYNLGNYVFRSIYFIDTLNGFMAGNGGVIFKSTDGGNNWVNLNSGVINDLRKIKFIDINTGFACGLNSTFIKTTNGGTSWNLVSLPLSANINSFDVFGSTIIAGAGESLLKSVNLGATWSTINLNIRSKPAVTSVSLNSDSAFVFSLESGSIWYSGNGGTTFSYSRSPLFAGLQSINFLFWRGYAVSKDHVLVIRTLNSAESWGFPSGTTTSYSFRTVLPDSGQSTNKILDFNYQKRGILYALQQNLLYRSGDVGESWTFMSSLPYENFGQQLMVSMKDSLKMLAAMNAGIDSGKIYRTTNYGVNWNLVYSGDWDIIGNLMTQDPNHPDTVYLGIRDSIMRSTDFGGTWSKLADYPFLDWCDLAVNPANSNVLYAATNHYPAKLNKSTNGGLNWFTVDFVFDTLYSEMPAIATTNLNPNIIFHAQLGSTSNQVGLKRSYSQGSTWLFDVFPGISWAVDIAKDDPFTFAYGNESVAPFYLTTNGGINYFNTPNQYAEQILFYDKSNLFVTDGSEIYKMDVTYNMPIGIKAISAEIPVEFKIYQNFPNPFNPLTSIKFEVPREEFVKLFVYDMLGRAIETIVNEKLSTGIYKVEFDGTDLASGIYFYSLNAGEFRQSRKMVLIK